MLAQINPLTSAQCAAMQAAGVITANNPVPCERLRRVSFQHVDFAGQDQTGELIVLDAVAPHVGAIFAELYQARFPLKKAVPLENYHGSDELSMNDNNTSAFNGRAMTGGGAWSKHAYGVAIDVNPLQNPYISVDDAGKVQVLPTASAMNFLNRDELRPEKPKRAGLVTDAVVAIFARHGFVTWGGYWDAPIDYQHFEIGSRAFVNELIKQTPEQASQTFNEYVRRIAQSCSAASVKEQRSCSVLMRK
ncbi:M15 family metallopeptidase [Chitinibacter bivalviorum]|uniref:M15 family metallopeptidase n=1 Tax=Chitinibacter bivalviorum TaxID=2739434 RepID=A0A7H9BJV8_9NEIS|nr:M15 family metallopeptidase [Chitinibacter bivalviorum]QLG88977.1 M15 family metallopeptidase [Chitinibacter bivalviorum]